MGYSYARQKNTYTHAGMAHWVWAGGIGKSDKKYDGVRGVPPEIPIKIPAPECDILALSEAHASHFFGRLQKGWSSVGVRNMGRIRFDEGGTNTGVLL